MQGNTRKSFQLLFTVVMNAQAAKFDKYRWLSHSNANFNQQR